LGNWIAIENKTHPVHGGLSESIEIPEKSQVRNSSVLTRQKCGRKVLLLSLHLADVQRLKVAAKRKDAARRRKDKGTFA
jgi:hypothetical protein